MEVVGCWGLVRVGGGGLVMVGGGGLKVVGGGRLEMEGGGGMEVVGGWGLEMVGLEGENVLVVRSQNEVYVADETLFACFSFFCLSSSFAAHSLFLTGVSWPHIQCDLASSDHFCALSLILD